MTSGLISSAARRLFGRHARAKPAPAARYASLHAVFELQVPRKRYLLEIGTFKGKTATALINIARRYEPADTIHYYGFDLWEDMDKGTRASEVSKRRVTTMAQTHAHIAQATGLPKQQIHLFRGFSKDTLWRELAALPLMDFIFIDGGHSAATVDSDWRACERLMRDDTVVIFDDYFHFPFGPRQVIDQLDRDSFAVNVLAPQDVFTDQFGIAPDGVLKINLAQVTRRPTER